MLANSCKVRIVDLSSCARAGLKGAAASTWLAARGVAVPEIHRAALQTDGSLLCRLSPSEYLAVAPAPGIEHPAGLPAFALNGDNEPGLCPVPRLAANVWFAVTGGLTAECLAKLCGLDLNPKRFANLTCAQTIVARTSVTVIRDDLAGELRYHLLADRTMAAYLWDVLCDAAAEFAG